MQQDLIPCLWLRGDVRLRADWQIDADTRFREVDRGKTDDERQRGHDLEIDQRAKAHRPTTLK
jgi:hypothetical protein